MTSYSPDVKKTVTDYDFLSVNGLMTCHTIDHQAGDTIKLTDDQVQIELAARPSIGNPDETIPAESVRIYLKHILSIQCRDRVIVELTPSQRADRMNAILEAVGDDVTV